MKFKDLSVEEKVAIHQALLANATALGGKNFLLQLIEDVKKEPVHPLSSKEKHFSFSKGFVQWDKAIYQETLDGLFTAILTQEREGDVFSGLKEKEKKRTMNMLKTLKPVTIQVKPKNIKEGDGFALSIVELLAEDKPQISLMFRVLFFYNIDFAKTALSFEVK